MAKYHKVLCQIIAIYETAGNSETANEWRAYAAGLFGTILYAYTPANEFTDASEVFNAFSVFATSPSRDNLAAVFEFMKESALLKQVMRNQLFQTFTFLGKMEEEQLNKLFDVLDATKDIQKLSEDAEKLWSN